MKIHEYQAKEILKRYQVPIQNGIVVQEEAELPNAISSVVANTGKSQVVIKAQIHAGGRGKGGGVQFCPTPEAALAAAKRILGMQLITPQTGVAGQRVRKVMVCEALDLEKEFYVALTLDRAKEKNLFLVSQAGGMDIETVAAESPKKIYREWIVPELGLLRFQALALTKALGLKKTLWPVAQKLFASLYRVYLELDVSLLEVNPLVLTKEGNLIALDAKMNFDDNALYRQKEVATLQDPFEESAAELEAARFNLNFIKLDGAIGCLVNGAGLAMATMDLIKLQGGAPANFLDVGGGANVESVKNAFRIILQDRNVKAVLVNIFGGIVRCDRVAGGIIAAVKELGLSVPVVVRLAGTNADLAKQLIDAEKINVVSCLELKEAALKVVELAAQRST